MIKYLVKHTSKATPENSDFVNEISIAYYGKNQTLVSREGDHAEKLGIVEKLSDWYVKEYGYNRRCDAIKSYVYKNPENTKYWKSTVEIVEVNV